MLMLDNDMADEMENLAPHKSAFDLTKPFNVAGALSMPKPVVGTISNWMSSPD